MNIQMNTAAMTLTQLQKKLDTVSNNISNVNTPGYKRTESNFQDVLTRNIQNQPHKEQEIGRLTPNGIRLGHGAALAQNMLRTEQGSAQETGRALDFMIEGKNAWFPILRGEEVHYTRSGSFHLQENPENVGELRLVTAEGAPLLDANGAEISFSNNLDTITVSRNGILRASNAAGEEEEFQLGLSYISNPQILESVGNNEMRLSGNEEELIANGSLQVINLGAQNDTNFTIRQGVLEMSNVDLTKEMTDLMTTQRMIQLQGRSISIADEMMGVANSIRG